MAHKVQVNAGVTALVLPDGNVYDGVTEVTLTDDEFARIRPALFTDDILDDLGSVADPGIDASFATDVSLASAVNPVQVIRATGNFQAAVAAVWTDLDPGGTAAARPLDVVLPGMAVGNGFEYRPIFAVASVTGGFLLNLVAIKNGTVARRMFPPGTLDFGYIPWNAPSGQGKEINAATPRLFVQEGDLEDDGSLRLRLQYQQATNPRTINADVGWPMWLEGRGPFV